MKGNNNMFESDKKAFPTSIRGVRRGDIYYADLGSVEDALGHEMVKKTGPCHSE